MGTRHLIAVQIDNEYKVAQYGQWDGYPSGQGIRILKFLQMVDLNDFAKAVRACNAISEDYLDRLWESFGAVNGMISFENADRFSKAYPHLSRDTGSKILGLIMQARDEGLLLRNSIEFAADSLFCEWAYVIDLDQNTFEVYEGFNKTPLAPDERFSYLTLHGNEYHPVKHVVTYKLNELPTQAEFLDLLEPRDEE